MLNGITPSVTRLAIRFGAAISLGAIAIVSTIALAGPKDHPLMHENDGTNWASYGRTFSENHYTPLDQINENTISRLGLAWSFDIQTPVGSFTSPLAVDGVIYFGVGHSLIHAVDARTGVLLWKFDPEVYKFAGHKLRGGWNIRGIAYDNGKVFTGTLDGRLIALDAKTGKLLWSVMTVETDDVRYIAGVPWVFNGKVIIGHGGSDYGPVRGYVTAYDQATGKQAWRFYTVPGDPAKGYDDKGLKLAAKTWSGEWWKNTGGATVWHAMAYDPKYNRIYLGTGNGAPWNGKLRGDNDKGDNLFICSIVAVDADTGKYVWHYQTAPGDNWDYDADTDMEMADLVIDGKLRSVLMQANKNGFYYVIDRKNGKLISANNFVKVTWADRIDLKTGRPVEAAGARFENGKTFVAFPSPQGAHTVQAMSFSPKQGLAYIPAGDDGRVYVDPPNMADWKFQPKMRVNTGLGTAAPGTTPPLPARTSVLVAWDPVKQKEAWSIPMNGGFNGGTLATAGDIVFEGLNTGEVIGVHAATGKKLWSFDAQNGILGQPISYSVDGRQFVAIITGFRSSLATNPAWDYYTQKRRLLVFALDGKGTLPADNVQASQVLDDPAFVIDPKKADIGKGVFFSGCHVCHGVTMVSGGAAPDLRKASSPMSFDTLWAVLHDGALMPNGMAKFEELTKEDVEGVQHFIRQRARESLAAGK